MAESTPPAVSSPPPPPPPPPINATLLNTVPSKNPPTNPPPSLTFSHTISKKMDTKNYLLWCQQVKPVIKGHRLHHFLVNPQIPQKYLSIIDRDSGQVSESYLAWEQQDQLLLSWLQSSMSKDILTRVIGCKTSFQLRDKIHSYFHSHMNAKARQLRNELRSTNLDNQTISNYVLRIQTLVDALTTIGDSVSVKEHLDIILEGLPEEYESTISLIISRFDMLSIDEVETIREETRIINTFIILLY
uniref:Retrovirus-related Pol polyprotein from transposon TNT 1-94 n=1 Tax=Cajanus cajan TaxID=3821 RepID=A0A151S9U5_CAJCA|nr:hypothetical protein KK1_026564 [Cajanus cajan]